MSGSTADIQNAPGPPGPHNGIGGILCGAAVDAYDSLISLVYPSRCLLCGRFASECLCDDCRRSLIVPLPKPFCPKCGHPRKGSPCLACKEDPPLFDAARAAGQYVGDLKDLIHKLKYHDKPMLAVPLGKLLAEHAYEVQHSLGELEFDYVVAAPMHSLRKRRRGYNQAERLARVVAAELALPFADDLLVRSRITRPQVGLKHDDRLRNVETAFRLGKRDPRRLTILIVDDVSTTGATLRACASPLKQAGAKAVYGLTLAAG